MCGQAGGAGQVGRQVRRARKGRPGRHVGWLGSEAGRWEGEEARRDGEEGW